MGRQVVVVREKMPMAGGWRRRPAKWVRGGLLLCFVLGGGAASEAAVVRFDPPKPRLGDVFCVYLEAQSLGTKKGTIEWLSFKLPLFWVSKGVFRGVLPVPVDIEPGPYPVRLSLVGTVFETSVTVVYRSFEESELKVSRRFTKKKKSRALRARLKRERNAMKALWQIDPGPPTLRGSPTRPVNTPVTGLFGTRRIFNGKRKSTHYGLDLDGKTGDPVRAAAQGKVVMSARRWASGGTLVIDHGGGVFSAYFHLSKRLKKRGAFVKKGALVGAVGQTGRVTGPHLHFAVVVRAAPAADGGDGQARSMYVDPQSFLRLDFRVVPPPYPGTQPSTYRPDPEDRFGGPEGPGPAAAPSHGDGR